MGDRVAAENDRPEAVSDEEGDLRRQRTGNADDAVIRFDLDEMLLDLEAPRGLLRARYPQYADVAMDGPVVEIAVSRWSGWRYAGA